MKPSWVLTEDERKIRFKKGDKEFNDTRPASSSTGRKKQNKTQIRMKATGSINESSDISKNNPTDHRNYKVTTSSPPLVISNVQSDMGLSAPSFGGFMAETPLESPFKKEMQIGEMLESGEILVGQGMIREAKDVPQPKIQSLLPSHDDNFQDLSYPLNQIKDEPGVSTSSILTKSPPQSVARPSVLKIKEELIRPSQVNSSSDESETIKPVSHCSVITGNFSLLEYTRPQQTIKDVIKEDPDFNIDIDLLEASLIEENRQLKIADAIDCNDAAPGITDLVSHIGQKYILSPIGENESDDDNENYGVVPHTEMMTSEEERYLVTLVANHDRHYKSVNFGEEMIKELMMCSMFGIPISNVAAINGYKLCVERITLIAKNLKEFQQLRFEDQSVLLKENADLLVCLRSAIFFDPQKTGVDQVLVSMGVKDMELLNTMFAQAMKEVANMKHIEYKNFNSIQTVHQSPKEDRYKYILEKVGKSLHDNTIIVLLTHVVLFSSDFCHQLEDLDFVRKTQEFYINLLQKYLTLKSNGIRLQACLQMANALELISMLREMADTKKNRNVNSNIKL